MYLEEDFPEDASSPPFNPSSNPIRQLGINENYLIHSNGQIICTNSSLILPEYSFSRHQGGNTNLDLCFGWEGIGNFAFDCCGSFESIKLPPTLKYIGNYAFHRTSSLSKIDLPDSLHRIGHHAFSECIVGQIRIPPLVYEIPMFCFQDCIQLFSVELPPTGIGRILGNAFRGCINLRNIALPPDAEINGYSFSCPIILQMRSALKYRFHGLPLHELCYYASYYEPMNQLGLCFKAWVVHPTGNQQDCLGMTPLHILTCSTIQRTRGNHTGLYRILVSAYPENLTTTDRWGALPFLYAIWGDLPWSVIGFLVMSYQQYYPIYKLNWEDMILTLCKAGVSIDTIRDLRHARDTFSSNQSINWNALLTKLSQPESILGYSVSDETFNFLLQYCIEDRLKALRINAWREEAENRIARFRIIDGYVLLSTVLTILDTVEERDNNLKESLTLLELALWKTKIDASESGSNRSECRVSCGADLVIENVLLYVLPETYVKPASWLILDHEIQWILKRIRE